MSSTKSERSDGEKEGRAQVDREGAKPSPIRFFQFARSPQSSAELPLPRRQSPTVASQIHRARHTEK